MYTKDVLCSEYVQEEEVNKALSKLNGMHIKDIKKITGISDEYYLHKILFKKIPMSGYIYFKIIEDVKYNETSRMCIRCKKGICSLNRLYCRACDDKRISNSIINRGAPDDSLFKNLLF